MSYNNCVMFFFYFQKTISSMLLNKLSIPGIIGISILHVVQPLDFAFFNSFVSTKII
jgi:hypothetical protein